MVVPGHHGGDLVQHLDRGGRALGGAGAQLALVVAAPGQRVPSAFSATVKSAPALADTTSSITAKGWLA